MTTFDGEDEDQIGLRRSRRFWFIVIGLVLLSMVSAVVLAFLHPKSGHHRDITALVVVLVIIIVIGGLLGFAGWRVLARRFHTPGLMSTDWRTRRRVGRALLKGRPIPEDDQPVARAIVDYYKKLSWLPWLYVGTGVIWLCGAALGRGGWRWYNLVLAVFWLSLAPYWFRLRNKITGREAEIAAS